MIRGTARMYFHVPEEALEVHEDDILGSIATGRTIQYNFEINGIQGSFIATRMGVHEYVFFFEYYDAQGDGGREIIMEWHNNIEPLLRVGDFVHQVIQAYKEGY